MQRSILGRLAGFILNVGKAPMAAYWAFGFFVAWLLIASIPSINAYESLATVWLWALYGLIFYASSVLQRKFPKWIDIAAHISIAVAIVLSIISIHSFFTNVAGLAYPRMRGMFDSHNIYASFLVFPMVASWWYALKNSAKDNYKPQLMWLYAACSVVLVSQFVLTFSRGAWVAFAAAGVIFVIWHAGWLKKECKKQDTKLQKTFFDGKIMKKESALILFAGLVLSMVIFFAAVRAGGPKGVEVTPYATETAIENGLTARYNYMSDGFSIAKSNLGFGVGPGQYQTAIKHAKRNFEFYSANSHNSLINLLAEAGIMGLILGMLLVLCVVYVSWKACAASRYSGVMAVAVFSVGTMLLHSLVDAGVEYRAIEVLFWILAGCIVGNWQSVSGYMPRRMIAVTAIIIALVLAAGSGVYTLASSYLGQSKASVKANPPRSFELAMMSEGIVSWNPEADIAAAEALMQIMGKMPATASGTPISAQKKQIGEDALAALDSALSKVDCSEKAQIDRFYVLNMLNRYEESVQALRNAIVCNPTAAHETYLLLARILGLHGDKQEVIDLANQTLPMYESYIASGWFATSPLQGIIKATADSLRQSRDAMCASDSKSAKLRGCDGKMKG